MPVNNGSLTDLTLVSNRAMRDEVLDLTEYVAARLRQS